MKVYTKNQVVIAEAETVDDVALILSLRSSQKEKSKEVGYPVKRVRIARKTYLRKCGKKFHGKIGLGTHMRKVHGVFGVSAKGEAPMRVGTAIFGEGE